MTDFKPIIIHHKNSPGYGRLAGLIFLLVCIGISVLIFFLSKDFLNSREPLARSMPFFFTFLFVAAGILVNFFLARQEYDEYIEITTTRVKYEKKGRFRKPEKWIESLRMYSDIEFEDEDSEEDNKILTLIMKHSRFKRKDIVLDKEMSSERELYKKKQYYLTNFQLKKNEKANSA